MRNHVRTAFLSDIHLGSRECRAEEVLGFLDQTSMDELYLVGDIIDLWALKKGIYWPQSHNDVLRKILSKARHGTRVVYVPGNHDGLMRGLCENIFGKLEVHEECIHTTARGMRMLVLHGDRLDGAVKVSRWLAWLGGAAYDTVLRTCHYFNLVRRWLRLRHWSLVRFLKSCVPNARRYIDRYEQAAALLARERGCDGVICGHIHHPAIRDIEGTLYCNDGDWVEHCTVLVETQAGELELWQWDGVPVQEYSPPVAQTRTDWPRAA
jgi:UDP-2,3-diacylglucosamine pyrophosphatase LpxH